MSDALDSDILPPHLVKGYEVILAGDFRRERIAFGKIAAWGHTPHSLVIGCCDSRVMPEKVFSAAPGEIFDLRNIANLVPPYAPDKAHAGVWAAVNYAVETLKVGNIIVLGHARCCGVPDENAASAEESRGDCVSIESQSTLAAHPGNSDGAEQLALRSVMRSLANLRGHPDISGQERQGALRLHGAYFDIGSKRLLALHEGRGQFVSVAVEVYATALRATVR